MTTLTPFTSFIGRTGEIDQVRKLLARTRLVTLTGPGGSGKTRLALAVATDIAPTIADDVVVVPLSSITDPSLVPVAIATTLNIRESANRSTLDTVITDLADRATLIVLDNMEHVLDSAQCVAAILASCSRVRFLVTSRIPLRLSGEQLFPVPPLGLPRAEALPPTAALKHDAVRLFVERACAIRPDFQLTTGNVVTVMEICRHLDGLPLAIELAAARVRHMTPDAILTRMDRQLALLAGGPRDMPERQQTMQAAIAWSYELLSSEQQQLFRQMSIFVSGWALDAAEAVSDAVPDVFDGLSTLVDHNLVQHGEQPDGTIRYRMLEPIREFGWEQLRSTGEAGEAQQRLAACVARLVVSDKPPTYWSPISDSWLQRCVLEHANIGATLDWYMEHEPRGALRLASSLYWFWRMQGLLVEGSRWLEEALQNSPDATTVERAKALASLADLACWQSQFDRAAYLYEESHALYLQLGDMDGIGRSQYGLGRVAHFQGDFQFAQERYEECIAFYDAVGDLNGRSSSHFNLAAVLSQTGDLDRAQRLYEESHAQALLDGDHATLVIGFANLAAVAALREDWPQVLAYTDEALRLYHSSADVLHTIECIEYVGMVLAATGQRERAARLWGAADAQRQRTGYPAIALLQQEVDEQRAAIERQLGPAAFAAAFAEGRSLSIDDAIADALAVQLPPVAPTAPGPAGSLSKREMDVLRLIVDGKTNQEIAAALFISPNTVMNHVASILNKLGVESRTAAATYAVRADLV